MFTRIINDNNYLCYLFVFHNIQQNLIKMVTSFKIFEFLHVLSYAFFEQVSDSSFELVSVPTCGIFGAEMRATEMKTMINKD